MASVVIAGDTSGSISVTVPATAGSNTITLPAVTGTAVISGQNSAITAGTAVASTSGTSIDFTSIPSWVKRVTVMFSGVSTNGSSNLQIQIGAGSVTTSGYLGTSHMLVTGISYFTPTTGFGIFNDTAAALRNGAISINLLGSNTWAAFGVTSESQRSASTFTSGSVALGGTLDRVRITTVNGTDTFDAGTINILYE